MTCIVVKHEGIFKNFSIPHLRVYVFLFHIYLLVCEIGGISPSLLAFAGDGVPPGCLGEAEALDLLGPMSALT